MQVLALAEEAMLAGCKQENVCEILGTTERSLQRWRLSPVDRRQGPKTLPGNKLTPEEEKRLLTVANSEVYRDKSPRQIVPLLADQGEYLASESTFYRVLARHKQLTHRGKSKSRVNPRPRALTAIAPNQVYSWDITYLPTTIRGRYFYLYLFLDVFSRKIVGWAVHEQEAMDLSARLLLGICEREKINKNQVTVHADNGGPMKGSTMLVTMERLGVNASFSRPSVSNDNPFSESLFKTVKYCPQYPTKPFGSIEEARAWVAQFVHWYNTEHLHSGIKFVTPESKHQQKDEEILNKRHDVYEKAKLKNPTRWSGKTRNWESIRVVKLNHLKIEKGSDTHTLSQRVS